MQQLHFLRLQNTVPGLIAKIATCLSGGKFNCIICGYPLALAAKSIEEPGVCIIGLK
jgi:hypothetical protein